MSLNYRELQRTSAISINFIKFSVSDQEKQQRYHLEGGRRERSKNTSGSLMFFKFAGVNINLLVRQLLSWCYSKGRGTIYAVSPHMLLCEASSRNGLQSFTCCGIFQNEKQRGAGGGVRLEQKAFGVQLAEVADRKV